MFWFAIKTHFVKSFLTMHSKTPTFDDLNFAYSGLTLSLWGIETDETSFLGKLSELSWWAYLLTLNMENTAAFSGPHASQLLCLNNSDEGPFR